MFPSSNELLYFLEIANTLNVSRAAERLGISQPSLSVAIKRLEEILGTDVLIRHKRGVHLTQAGKQLQQHARELVQKWEDIKSETLASKNLIQGHYTLGCHPSIGRYAFAKLLPELIEKYPKLELHFKHEISRKIVEEVISLSIDIAIVVNPIRHPDLIITKLFNDEVTLWENRTKVKGVSVPPIIFDPDLPQPQVLLKQFKKTCYERIITSSNLDVIASLTENGCGIGILPKRVVESTYPKSLTRVPNAPVYQDEICLVYRHENRNVASIQTIITAIKKFAANK